MTAIKEDITIGNILLIRGNCYEIIKDIEDNSIDLIHTDPPYLIHSEGDIGKYLKKKTGDFYNNIAKANVHNDFDRSIFKEFERISKNINYQIWCSKKQFYDYLVMANKNNWNWQDIHLFRNNALPNVNGKYQDHDYCIHLWKGRKITGSFRNKRANYHWNIGAKDWKHPTLKPVEPIENLIYTGSNENELILDCFMGSGSTGIACLNTGRKFIGIEKEKEYFDIAVKRVTEASRQGGLDL